MEKSKVTATTFITFETAESSINNEEKHVHIAQSMTDCNKYYIFRDSGVEVAFTIENNHIMRFTRTLFPIEENFINKYILKKNDET